MSKGRICVSTALDETQDVFFLLLAKELSDLAHAKLLILAGSELPCASAWHKLLWVVHLQPDKKILFGIRLIFFHQELSGTPLLHY